MSASSKNPPLNPKMNKSDIHVQNLKDELPAFDAVYRFNESDDLDAMFHGCSLLEEDLGLGETWIIYDDISTEYFDGGDCAVTIRLHTDADISEFTIADEVTEVQE